MSSIKTEKNKENTKNQDEEQEKLNKDNQIQKNQDLDLKDEKIKYLENQLKISVADFSNYKKRVLKDIENMKFLAESKIILDFLNFKETLENAIKFEKQELFKNSLKELNNNFENILKRLNIKKIELKDKVYDYNLSECVQTLKVKDKDKNNKILEVLEEGYTYNDNLLKPGKVIVGKFTEE